MMHINFQRREAPSTNGSSPRWVAHTGFRSLRDLLPRHLDTLADIELQAGRSDRAEHLSRVAAEMREGTR